MLCPPTRKPHTGKPTLVIAIDVGTTFSGASYTFLKPDQIPKIHNVSHFEGQEHHSGSCKVPSVLYYDSCGRLAACGSQVEHYVPDVDEDEGTKVEWFKLLLRPASLRLSLDEAPDAKLPPGMKAVQVFGDFLRYMRACVQRDVCDRFIEGKQQWGLLIESARYVLSHPNGWEGPQQALMRKAAILGGLIPDTPADRERVEFVSEGEASFHWCVEMDVATPALSAGSHIVVADAGGGTIDVSSYLVSSVQPLLLQETASASCELSGSVFVTQRFKSAIEDLLDGSRYGDDEHIEQIVEEFDQTTKRIFRCTDRPTYIKMRSRKYNDPSYGIQSGQLKLPSDFITQTFEPSCSAAAQAIREHVANKENAHVFLTGGFGTNPWLYSELKRRLSDVVQDIKNGDSNSGKAVAHGAIAYYLDHHVNARIARHTLGLYLLRAFDESDIEHRARRAESYLDPISGGLTLGGGFTALVQKGDILDQGRQYTVSMVHELSDPHQSQGVNLGSNLYRYTGSKRDITFRDMDNASCFEKVCTFVGRAGAAAIMARMGTYGIYGMVEYTTILSLGGTELKCQIEWREKGKTKRGPMTSVWEDI